jgi:hypothetical protein
MYSFEKIRKVYLPTGRQAESVRFKIPLISTKSKFTKSTTRYAFVNWSDIVRGLENLEYIIQNSSVLTNHPRNI